MRESHQLVPIWALKQERERSEEHQHCGSTANRTCAKGDLVSVLDRGEVVPELVSGAVALLLNRGFCGWQAVFYHLNRGQYEILPLNRGQTFCHRKKVVLSQMLRLRPSRNIASCNRPLVSFPSSASGRITDSRSTASPHSTSLAVSHGRHFCI